MSAASGHSSEEVLDVQRTSCCIVGGGPAGMVLGLLLARRGIPVTVLEAHKDFDRDFRGDTLHPAILEILDQIGLAEPLQRMPHMKWYGPSVLTSDGPVPLIDFRRLRTRFPYIMLLPQERFLEFLAGKATKYPHFRLVMGARVQRLVEKNGEVLGVRYQESGSNDWREVRALLTVGADGRFSRVRHLAGIKPVVTSPPMQLLWFRLPRLAGDAQQFDSLESVALGGAFAVINGEDGSAAVSLHRGDGYLLALVNRVDHWQVAYIYAEGAYQLLKEAGIDAFRRSIAEQEPRLTSHLESLTDWRQLAPLSVAFSRCRRWYKPGLLLIGDAAHVMTPAAGAGIKYAIEDAVETANVLGASLRSGRIRTGELAQVQRRRECPTRFIQSAAGLQQRTILSRALRRGEPSRGRVRLPLLARLLIRLPLLRDLPARFIGFGFWRVRIEDTSEVVTDTNGRDDAG